MKPINKVRNLTILGLMLKKQLPLILPILISIVLLILLIRGVSSMSNQPQKQQQQVAIFPDALISPGVAPVKNDSAVFKSSEQVSFTLHLNRKISFKLPFFAIKKAMAQEENKNQWQGDGLKINTNIAHTGEPVDDLAVKIEQKNAEEFSFTIEDLQPGTFVPGAYALDITLTTDKGERTITQDFVWGVLAVNTNKSIFTPGEKVYLQMAALDKFGHTMCDADLKLEVTDPQGQTTTPDIQKSSTCGPDNVTDNPDYYSYYQLPTTNYQLIGKYTIKLTNNTNNYSIDDSFEVKESVPFVVERVGATRINPFASKYTMNIKVTANQDFRGEMVEQVPNGFSVVSQQLKWPLNLKAGQSTTISYTYQAPKISPQFFLLGPLKFIENSLVFEESRQWQIASDVITTLFMETPDATQGIQFWTASNGSVTYDTSQNKSGVASWKAAYTAFTAAYLRKQNIFSTQAGRATGYFRLQDFPTNFVQLHWARTGSFQFGVGVNGSGVLQIRTNTGGTQLGSNGSTLSQNTWYRISMVWNITNATTFTVKVFLNGVLDITANSGTLTADATNAIYNGWVESNSAGSKQLWFHHIYVDNDTSLTDTGDIRVTAKLPGTVNNNGFDTTGGTGAVNERPISTTNYMQDATSSTPGALQDYTLQIATQGDMDVSDHAVVARTAWVWAARGATGSQTTAASIIDNGSETAITLTATPAIYTVTTYSATYPSNANGIGMRAIDGTYDTYFYEGGTLIAYIPTTISKVKFNGIQMQGIQIK